MAQDNKPQGAPAQPKADPDLKYFKSHIYGLRVVVGDPDVSNGDVAPQYVRFVPYFVQLKGVAGTVKMGYLATSDGTALKKLAKDINVTEIDKAEYDEATEYHTDDSGVAYAGIRAPY